MASLGQDVEIRILAKDMVAPGVESARSKLMSRLADFKVDKQSAKIDEQETARLAAFSRNLANLEAGGKAIEPIKTASAQASESLGRMAGAGIKAGLAIGAARGAFNLATSAVHLFNGNSEGAVSALERLPFGIGSVVTSMKDLASAFDANGEAIKKAWDTLEGYKNALSDLKNSGTAELGGEAGVRAAFELETDAIMRKYAKGPDTSGMSQEQRQEAYRIQEESRSEEMRQATVRRDRSLFEESQKLEAAKIEASAKAAKQVDSLRKQLLDDAEEAKKQEDAMFTRNIDPALWVDEGAAQARKEQIDQQVKEARRTFFDEQSELQGQADFFGRAQGGSVGLGSGEVGRFITGVARAGQEKADAQESLLRKQIEIQERMLKALEASPPQFDIAVGVFN